MPQTWTNYRQLVAVTGRDIRLSHQVFVSADYEEAAHYISAYKSPHRPNWVLDDPSVVCLALITPGIKSSIKTGAVMILSQMPAMYHRWPLAERSAALAEAHCAASERQWPC